MTREPGHYWVRITADWCSDDLTVAFYYIEGAWGLWMVLGEEGCFPDKGFEVLSGPLEEPPS
jgi:hypothetical protein